ncbi:MAG: amidohydrolase family protein [Spirochaetales bacterium]|nr:amidohydrolase family protein [Spirochaetales bacterium]
MSIVFRNAMVVDGSGSRPFKADVVVDGDLIAKISADEVKADRTVDADGCILCPGFMDIHAHSELEALRNPSMPRKIQQGITFDLSGNCGIGVYPRKLSDPPLFADILGHYDNWSWTDFTSFHSILKPGINMAFLQSHSCLRNQAMTGNPNRPATESEIGTMCELLDTSLSQGCVGLSSGLYYAPCLFADRAEMVALLKVVRNHDGIFAVHHRCEGDDILSSIDEIISYTRETGVRLEISHLKAIGRKNQSKVTQVLDRIHALRSEGFDVAFDQYPYEYGSTSLFSLLPPELLRLSPEDLSRTLHSMETDRSLRDRIVAEMENPDGWDSIAELCPWEDIRIVIMESSPEFNGLNMLEAADRLGMDPFDALFHLLANESRCALMTDVTQTTESLRRIFSDDLMSFGTDALYAGEMAHPRSANGAIHLLCERCIKEGTPFETAINKMTHKVADRLGIRDRGLVKEGFKADLVMFNPKTLKDNSDTTHPFEMCTGLENVMVNGVFALKDGKLTGSQSGKVILK